MIHIGQRLRRGRQLIRAAYKGQDAAKLGTLRAGNTGIISVDGEVAGSCHRVAHLRQLGIEVDPPDDSQLIMFQAGTASEDTTYNDLRQTSVEGEVILREEEIPIEWFTSKGVKVTGRPDMVICVDDPSGTVTHPTPRPHRKLKPVICLELKSVASVWTTRTVLIEGEPKLNHLAQVAHYMWKLGTPGRLIYKQYANQAMPDFAHRYFPIQGKPGSEYLEYGTDGKPKCVRPYELVYELEFDAAGRLRFRREDQPDGVWCDTIVTTTDIERYYEYVAQMSNTQVLGPRPLTLSWDGSPKRYSNCDYCPLDPICDRAAKRGSTKQKRRDSTEAERYLSWLSDVRSYIAERDESGVDNTPNIE